MTAPQTRPGITVSPQKARAIVDRYLGSDRPLPSPGREVTLQRGEFGSFIPPGGSREIAPWILLQNIGGEYIVLGGDGPDYEHQGTAGERHVVALKPLPYRRVVVNPPIR